jgi:hypothetical protein
MRRALMAAIATTALLGAGAGQVASSGAAGQPLVKIGGPPKIQAASHIQFPIYCSAPCFVKVTARFDWPGADLVSTVSSTIQPGHPKVDRLTLNGPATAHLKANYKQSHLKVIARARNLETNAHQNDNRTFGFKR